MGWEVAEKVRSVYGDVQYTDRRGSCAPGYIQDGGPSYINGFGEGVDSDIVPLSTIHAGGGDRVLSDRIQQGHQYGL